jgi:Lanthionine-containing peptide SapB precursor RamS
MTLLDLQDMELPEALSGALMASWDDSNSGGGESNLSLLLCG